jgi:hypothetical protein
MVFPAGCTIDLQISRAKPATLRFFPTFSPFFAIYLWYQYLQQQYYSPNDFVVIFHKEIPQVSSVLDDNGLWKRILRGVSVKGLILSYVKEA